MAPTQWTRELAVELPLDGRGLPIPRTLALVDALDEMIEWVDDLRPFNKKHHTKAWKSTAEDLDAARADTGRRVRGLVDSVLAEFDVNSAVTRATANQDRQVELDRLRAVRNIVVSDEGVQAVWADVVDAGQRLAWPEVRVQLHNLDRVQAARADELKLRSWGLAGILRDDMRDVAQAQHDLGEPSSLDLSDPASAFDAKAGLSVTERAALASRSLRVRLPEAHFVVWLAVEMATMGTGKLTVGSGSVTFYDSRTVGAALKSASSDRSDWFPDEIRSAGALAESLPVGDFILLARMDMGVRSPSFVARDARTRLLALLAPIRRVHQNDWAVMSGSVVFRDREDVSMSSFSNLDGLDDAYRLDGVAEEWLEAGAADLEPLLVAPTSEPVARLLKLVEWDAAHRHGDPLTRVLLAVRTIETIAASHVGDKSWQQLLAAYRHRFAWSQLASELESTAHSLLYRSNRPLDEHGRNRRSAIAREVISNTHGATTTDLEAFLNHLPELIEIWDLDTEGEDTKLLGGRGVRIESLHALHSLWTDGDAFQARLQAVTGHLKLQESRLVRVRDAAQHGGPILDQSVESVVAIADAGRRWLIADMLDGLLKGRTCSGTLKAVQDLEGRRTQILVATRSPMTALAERPRPPS